MEDLSGKQFGRYQIVAALGEGGMAAVYKAYQPSMERYVAIKVLPRHMATSDEFVARFEREAKLLAQLQHPHILPVFDYGEAEGYTYIVMPMVASGTLADLMKKQRLNMSEIRRIMSQVGDALAYAHARGMIHRDIKPSNVLLDERGNCLLTDFGLARMTEASAKLTSSGAIMGTPAYMSPEQGQGMGVDQRSDLYALGIILYELVTGRVPYTAETPIAIVFKHISDPLPSARKVNPNLSDAVERVLYKALAKNPDDRYQTAEEFVHAVQAAIPETSTERSQPSQPLSPQMVATQVSDVQSRSAALPATQVSNASVKAPTRLNKPVTIAAIGVGLLIGIVLLSVVVFVAIRMFANGNNSPLPSPTADTPPPTEAPTVATAAPVVDTTATEVPTSAPSAFDLSTGSIFKDDFDGNLADGWDWVAEDSSTWSLTKVPGSLQIIASDASLDGSASPTNILFRNTEVQNFAIITHVHFQPKIDFQTAGLIIFQDGNNALQFGPAFCDDPDLCVGDGVYFDSVEDGSFTSDHFKAPSPGEDVYLLLRRADNLYIAYYSTDNESWTELGEITRDLNTVNVGLIAAQAPTPIAAQFDDFTLIEFPEFTANVDTSCYETPDQNASVTYTLNPGDTTFALGISKDGNWMGLQKPDDPKSLCWVATNGADLGDNADVLQVIGP
jgi:serine/threonine protein kinase